MESQGKIPSLCQASKTWIYKYEMKCKLPKLAEFYSVTPSVYLSNFLLSILIYHFHTHSVTSSEVSFQ